MKQICQNLKTGAIVMADIPTPRFGRKQLLISTKQSLVSAGTERMLLDFGQASWVGKARQQPEKVRMVLDKMHADGLVATYEAVRSKLDQPLALGYCNVGTVTDVGRDVHEFSIGDRVASNGNHAEMVAVPELLCARVPEGVSDEAAAFTVLGAIGLQGIRLANPTLGESVVVIGLGLIGLLTVQMLRAQGCRVMGIDLDPARLALAEQFGAEVVNPGDGEDVHARAAAFSRGRGVDAVLITASTKSNEPVSQAARMSRKRGRIVLVGVTGLELSRSEFYEKELSFQVSCSYGPGRYDPSYEEQGNDYPVGFVRWTEQRNFEAVLEMMDGGALDVEPLISHRFTLERAPEAYELLTSKESSLGILLQYPGKRDRTDLSSRVVSLNEWDEPTAGGDTCRVAFLGAGNYASRVLIPAFRAAGPELHTLVSAGGVSATHYGRKFGFSQAATDWRTAIKDETINSVVIATRHNSHAQQVVAALQAGKHVFCEKPLCLTLGELDKITETLHTESGNGRSLTVGFNRRFSPHVQRMKSLLAGIEEPVNFIMTVNAGAIPADHWTQAPGVGGGRIVGEACHFIDLLRHLADSPISKADGVALGQHPALETRADKATLVFRFENGSVGTIHYLANGHRSFPKERLEVFCGGRVLQLDNFRKLRGWGWKGFTGFKTWRQDKGSDVIVERFVSLVSRGGEPVIPVNEILEVSRVSIELSNRL